MPIQKINGVAQIGFDLGEMSRNSIAMSPDDGKCYQANVPRIAQNKIPILNAKPKLYYTFPADEPYMGYAENKPVGCITWCTGSGGRLTQFESEFPEFVKSTIGASNDGEDLFAYRLVKTGWGGNPKATKHFVVTCMVHGDESDGLNGAFKAMEILARNADFADFRDEWTILFVPFLNPDGWGSTPPTRNLTEVGPNGKTVNLNRQGNWFWGEYVESGYESKGSAPWSSSEGTAIYGLYQDTISNGGTWGVLIDMHATEGGGGARYLTRDRLLQHSTGSRGDGTSIPDSYLTNGLDYHNWIFSRAFTNLRVRKEDGPDLWLRLIRSRFSPKIHSYFSSQGIYSTVAEEAKVDSAPVGTVNYQSACHFRLDHILATALCCTAVNWNYEDAILIEKGTTNLLLNASFDQWQDAAAVSLDEQYTDDFTTENLNWTLTDILWVSTYLETSLGNAGYAKLEIVPKSLTQKVQCDLRLSGAGTLTKCFLAARATFAGTNVYDGYKLEYDDNANTWSIIRVNAGVETVLDSIAATATTQVTTTFRTAYLYVRYTNEVNIIGVMNGVELFDLLDSDVDKIVDYNFAGIGGEGDSVECYFDDFELETIETDERPGYFKPVRSEISRCTYHEGEKFFEDMGEALKLTAHVDLQLSQGAEFCAGALCEVGEDDSGVAIITSYDSLFYIPPENYDSGDLISPGSLAHPTPFGSVVFGMGTSQTVWVLGGGTSAFSGAENGWTRVFADRNSPASTYLGALTGMPKSMHSAFCDNTLKFEDLIIDTGWSGFMFGGLDDLGAYQNTVLLFDGSTVTTSAQTIPSASCGGAAIYNRNDDCCYIFGGMSATGPITDIYKYDCAGDSITDLSGLVTLPKALAYLAAAFCPGDGKVYIFGGEETTGIMSSTIYVFDPVGLTIEEITFAQNTNDEEGDEPGEGDWSTKIGRWHAVTQMDSYDDYGSIVLIGGRLDSNAGTLSDEIYIANPDDHTIGVFKSSEYGYFRYSTSYSLKFANVVTRDFDGESEVGADWSDPNSNWTIAGNVATSSAVGGPLICLTASDYINQRVYTDASSTGAIVSFSIFLRTNFSGANPQNGYELIYTQSDLTWRIRRWVSGVATIIFTYDASGSAARQINATPKQVFFRAMFRDPVEFYAYIVSGSSTYTLFSSISTYDYDISRVTQIGYTAFGGQSDTGNVVVDDFIFDSGAHNEEKFTCSTSVKSDADSISGYYRFSLMPSSYIDGIWITRYCSQYYFVPPKTQYYWARGRADLRNGLGQYREDQIRLFNRLYKDSQSAYFDGIHLAKGTLIPSSYHPEGMTRADEIFTFSDIINPNCFRLQFYWMPTFAFNDLDSDVELMRISIDAANYIALTAIAATGHERWCREFYQNSIDGPHFSLLRMTKVKTGSVVATVDLNCFFGAATQCDNDPVNEACEDVLSITIVHSQAIFELNVIRGGSVGIKTDNADTSTFSSQIASIIYNGVGYYSEPQLIDEYRSRVGRVIPARRRGLSSLLKSKSRHCYLSGDLDPTGGVVSTQLFYENAGRTFGYYDQFTGGDSNSLGSRWLEDIKKYGWKIESYHAVAGTSESYAQVAFPPRHADIRTVVNVSLSGNNSYFGIRSRFGCPVSDGRPDTDGNPLFGYEAKLKQTASNSATLSILRYHKTAIATLDSVALSSYTDGEVLEMSFDLDGSTLIAIVTGRATITVTDDIHKRARNLGIVGDSEGGGYVKLDNFAVYANFETACE